LAGSWEPAFPSNAAKLAGDFSIMLALRKRGGIFPFIHKHHKQGLL
jgi:hypothetical protein